LAIDQETKNKITVLFFKKRLPIREITRITKKSSRDIIAVLKKSESYQKEEGSRKIDSNNTKEPNKMRTDLIRILRHTPKHTSFFLKESDRNRRR
jgi:hypothetical protein